LAQQECKTEIRHRIFFKKPSIFVQAIFVLGTTFVRIFPPILF
jgi:hypothetical protein